MQLLGDSAGDSDAQDRYWFIRSYRCDFRIQSEWMLQVNAGSVQL